MVTYCFFIGAGEPSSLKEAPQDYVLIEDGFIDGVVAGRFAKEINRAIDPITAFAEKYKEKTSIASFPIDALLVMIALVKQPPIDSVKMAAFKADSYYQELFSTKAIAEILSMPGNEEFAAEFRLLEPAFGKVLDDLQKLLVNPKELSKDFVDDIDVLINGREMHSTFKGVKISRESDSAKALTMAIISTTAANEVRAALFEKMPLIVRKFATAGGEEVHGLQKNYSRLYAEYLKQQQKIKELTPSPVLAELSEGDRQINKLTAELRYKDDEIAALKAELEKRNDKIVKTRSDSFYAERGKRIKLHDEDRNKETEVPNISIPKLLTPDLSIFNVQLSVAKPESKEHDGKISLPSESSLLEFNKRMVEVRLALQRKPGVLGEAFPSFSAQIPAAVFAPKSFTGATLHQVSSSHSR